MSSSKLIIITGANTGLGWALCKKLVSDNNTKIIMACRSLVKANDVKEKSTLTNDQKKNLVPYQLNLGQQNSIHEFVDKIKKDFPEGIHALINNAGVYNIGCNDRMETEDQHELHFGTNHLGHFTLTLLLLESLRKGAMYGNCDTRIVMVSSSLYKNAKFDFNDLQIKKPGVYTPGLAYANSKMANIMFTRNLHERLKKDRTGQPGAGRIKIYANHPGVCYTDLGRHHTKFVAFIWWLASKIILRTPEQGIVPSLECLERPTSELSSGSYYGNGGSSRSANSVVKNEDESLVEMAKDEEISKKLWEVSEELTGVTLEQDCSVMVSGPTNAMMF